MTGKVPYRNQLDIVKAEPPTFKPGFDENAKDLICQLLKKEPENRIGAKEFDEIKEHPFFATVIWENLRNINVPYISPA